jgi:phosphoglycerate dehydrogenase-like enzyme
MSDIVKVMITFYLEQELVNKIKNLDTRIEVLYEPALMGRPRYQSHHIGFQGTPKQEKIWLELMSQADVIFGYISRAYLQDLPKLAPRLKWNQSPSTGIGQMVNRSGLIESDIIFTTAGGVHVTPLSEFVMMAMLMFVKDAFRMTEGKERHHWERYCGTELRGKTLAVISLGRTGKEIARLAKAFGMLVIGTKRHIEKVDPDSLYVEKLYPWTNLHPLLSQADFVVLCIPHTSETEGMIGETEFAVMKQGSVLINIARGSIIDESALIQALKSDHLAGAAIDVAAKEPLPHESPLWDMPNVVISPHSASTADNENKKLTDLFCDNLLRYLNGRQLRNVLNKKMLY